MRDITAEKKELRRQVRAKGIKTLKDAEDFLNLGADRLGTSRVVKIIKTDEEKKYEISDTAY